MKHWIVTLSLVAVLGVPLAFTDRLATARAADHPHDGPKHALGKVKVGDHTATVTQVGEVKAGKGVTFEIVLADGKGEPKAVRAWVGVESAKGSVKGKATKTEKFYDADLEVPAPLPDGSKVWIEVETDAGKQKASLEYKK